MESFKILELDREMRCTTCDRAFRIFDTVNIDAEGWLRHPGECSLTDEISTEAALDSLSGYGPEAES